MPCLGNKGAPRHRVIKVLTTHRVIRVLTTHRVIRVLCLSS